VLGHLRTQRIDLGDIVIAGIARVIAVDVDGAGIGAVGGDQSRREALVESGGHEHALDGVGVAVLGEIPPSQRAEAAHPHRVEERVVIDEPGVQMVHDLIGIAVVGHRDMATVDRIPQADRRCRRCRPRAEGVQHLVRTRLDAGRTAQHLAVCACHR
jgi:hypothetical protein